ncbi:hypothetical protein FSP39_006793 [Pinctada imbricata]|uniref:Uncharacterized protein n=1 Tax=Pinctada imbricata TaxID=66713 RepID=A0AA88Y2J3_PINIB|nr:hypothetical protein FSP39_006793 [Pinctada imbricata]
MEPVIPCLSDGSPDLTYSREAQIINDRHRGREKQNWKPAEKPEINRQSAIAEVIQLGGTLASATNFQAYLLDGLSRWNSDRAAVATSTSMSQTPLKVQTYSGLLRYTANQLSREVLEKEICPGYLRPNQYTGELIGIEYLYSQTGNVLQDYEAAEQTIQETTEAEIPPNEDDEDFGESDDVEDLTIPPVSPSLSDDLPMEQDDPPIQSHYSQQSGHPTAQMKASHSQANAQQVLPIPSETDYKKLLSSISEPILGPDNVGGYDKVQDLAEYLITFRNSTGALKKQEVDRIVQLWKELSDYDKRRTIFPVRYSSKQTSGRFRSPKKEFLPGVESTRKCFLAGNMGAAQWPDCNRYVEATMIKLCNLYPSSKRDKDGTLVNRWNRIQRAYQIIKDSILDNSTVMDETTLQFPNINRTTLTQWYNKRGKQQERKILTQGLENPAAQFTAPLPLPSAQAKARVIPVGSCDQLHEFKSPPNTAGTFTPCTKGRRQKPASAGVSITRVTSSPSITPPSVTVTPIPSPFPTMTSQSQYVNILPASEPTSATYSITVPTVMPGLEDVHVLQPGQDVPKSTIRYRKRKVEEEAKGLKRRIYTRKCNERLCKKCSLPLQSPQHKQYMGNLFCELSEIITYEEWLSNLKQKYSSFKRKKNDPTVEDS